MNVGKSLVVTTVTSDLCGFSSSYINCLRYLVTSQTASDSRLLIGIQYTSTGFKLSCLEHEGNCDVLWMRWSK